MMRHRLQGTRVQHQCLKDSMPCALVATTSKIYFFNPQEGNRFFKNTFKIANLSKIAIFFKMDILLFLVCQVSTAHDVIPLRLLLVRSHRKYKRMDVCVHGIVYVT